MRGRLQISGGWRSRWSFVPRCGTGILVLAGMLAVGGCGTKTEDGYDPPHRLGMSETGLRALYAPAFTQEAKAGDDDKTSGPNSHRGGMPGGL